TYWCQVSTPGCPPSTAYINISVTPNPYLELGNDTTLCYGEELKLSAFIPNSSATYLWSNGSTSPYYTVTSPGTVVALVSHWGCTSLDWITISYTTPTTHSLGSDTLMCLGDQLLLDASGVSTPYTWQDGSNDSTYLATSSGSYYLNISYVDNTSGLSCVHQIRKNIFGMDCDSLCTNNLVPNSSFEFYLTCPTDLSAAVNGPFTVEYAWPWFTPSAASSDYFNTCTGSDCHLNLPWVCVPYNLCGYQVPHTGNAYLGFITQATVSYREYVSTPLITPMVAGTFYKVSYWISLAETSSHGTSNTGIYFSNTDPELGLAWPHVWYLPYTPQLVDTSTIMNTAGWTLVTDTFLASGGEQYITIGSFEVNNSFTPNPDQWGSLFQTYYYIDDVSVVPLDTMTVSNDTSICPGDSAILYAFNSSEYVWADSLDLNNILSTDSMLTVNPTVTSTYAVMNCFDTLYVNVIISPIPPLPALSPDSTYCENTPFADMTAAGIGGAINWYADSGLTNLLGTGNSFPPLNIIGTTTYYVAEGLNGCMGPYDSISITITTPPYAGTDSVHSFCSYDPNADLFLDIGGSPDPGGYWFPAMNSGTGVFNPTLDPSGTYYYIVQGIAPCTDDTSQVSITVYPATNINTTQTDISCYGAGDGTATVTITGGMAPYSYSWSPGGNTSAALTGLDTGTYVVTVTDSGGCVDSAQVVITSPAELIITGLSGNMISCADSNDGSATATVTGGTMPYTFFWAPSSDSTATISNLAAGVYFLTVTDTNSCTTKDSLSITEPPPITTSTSSSLASCALADGTATVIAGGGTGAYTYLWNSGAQTNATATGLAVGSYFVTVSDTNGCTAIDSVAVTDTGMVVVSIVSVTNPSCYGWSDGSITAFASNGTPPYFYTWDDPLAQTDSIADGLAAGTYNVTVNDNVGCVAIVSQTLVEPDTVVLFVSPDTTICIGDTATISAAATGGTQPYV
ncbi:MAG TPA: hypothetical protein EYN51_08895, partial [Flavobacteriales bacterium]|nr:hypothetical protein [Flavobacteriales bacterium]